ncbi:MAG TPA: alpha/beta hydrolase [Terracidiphilus sp.]|nr:alpha/beta hydrolase [Terracidiphilus sp.]
MSLFVLLAGLGLVLILAGVLYQINGAWQDRRRFTRDGRWIHLANGQRLFLLEKGSRGGPLVIFESGIAATHLNWIEIQRVVSGFAATASYDRGGLGWSSPCVSARTPSNVAAELHGMLECAGIKPPYVLVGHSFGGFIMRRFAGAYPREVSSVVLIDPMRCDEWPPVNEAQRGAVKRGIRLSGYAIPIARLGVARLAVTSLLCRSGRVSRWLTEAGGNGAQQVMGRVRSEIGKMPREAWPIVAAHWSRPAFYAGMRAHVRSVPDSVREMLAEKPIRGIPVLVLTPDSSQPLSAHCLEAIGDNVRQVIVPNSAHWVHLDQPQTVINAIREIMCDSGTKATGQCESAVVFE